MNDCWPLFIDRCSLTMALFIDYGLLANLNRDVTVTMDRQETRVNRETLAHLEREVCLDCQVWKERG